jgi:hypothetical protein
VCVPLARVDELRERLIRGRGHAARRAARRDGAADRVDLRPPPALQVCSIDERCDAVDGTSRP